MEAYSSNKIKHFFIDKFKVTLYKTSEGIVIEAENTKDSRLFLIEIKNDSVEETTSYLFENVDDLCDGLIDSQTGDYPLTVAINDEGKLTFTCETQVGRKKRNIKFTIALKEKKLGSLSIFERYLNELKEIKTESQFEKELVKMLFKQLEYEKEKENKLAKARDMLAELEKRHEAK